MPKHDSLDQKSSLETINKSSITSNVDLTSTPISKPLSPLLPPPYLLRPPIPLLLLLVLLEGPVGWIRNPMSDLVYVLKSGLGVSWDDWEVWEG